jgi:prepilin-type N-terminal cleavage/methylation domain-containing protein
MPPRGFTLTELLIVVAIILGLMTLLGSAVANVRTTQKANATRDMIAKLDRIISAQIETYDSRPVTPAELANADLPPNSTGIKYFACQRAWHIRRNLISADIPDRWSDLKYMYDMATASPAKWLPRSPFQRTYISLWDATTKSVPPPTDQFAGAECLFMIVMQSGVANCLDCGSLTTSQVGDKDGDGYMEFHDAWGNPIGYILWAPAYEAPGKGTAFFTGLDDPYGTSNVRPSLGMRPLIYSAGPDGEYGLNRNSETATLATKDDQYGAACGNYQMSPTSAAGAPSSGAADNITNFDAEAKQ